jgi:hypothetical protein
VIFLSAGKPYTNRTPTAVWIREWVIAQRVEMIQVIADRRERLLLFVPILRELSFASGGGGHSLENGGRHGFELRLACADHVNDDTG